MLTGSTLSESTGNGQAHGLENIAEAAVTGCIVTRVRRLSRIITRLYDYDLKDTGITASQFILLTQIAREDGVAAVTIGRTLDIEKSTLSRNLKRMLKLELLTTDPPRGRARRGLHLTEKGKHVIGQAYPIWAKTQAKVEEVMGSQSRVSLDQLLALAEKLDAAV